MTKIQNVLNFEFGALDLFVIWCLEFGAYLTFGAWNLNFIICGIAGIDDEAILDRRKWGKSQICLSSKRVGIVSGPLLIWNDVLLVRRP